ncbi:MAG: hypothetical protein ACPG4N_02565, partial [Gammaproteobacteria bacterium]
MSHLRRFTSLAFAVLVTLILSSSAQAAVMFKTDFDPSTWTATQVGGSGSHTFTPTENAGGNGDSSALNIYSYLTGGSTSIGYFISFDGLTYNPGTQGAIDSIDFSLDRMRIPTPYGGHGYGIAMQQDGIVYYRGTTANTSNAWGQFTDSGLTSVDFFSFFSSGPGLDLGGTGTEIQFGMVIYSGNGGSPQRYDQTRYDNYSVTLNEAASVPVPAPIALIALAGLAV